MKTTNLRNFYIARLNISTLRLISQMISHSKRCQNAGYRYHEENSLSGLSITQILLHPHMHILLLNAAFLFSWFLAASVNQTEMASKKRCLCSKDNHDALL